MNGLKRSDDYKRKICMINKEQVPTQSEIKYRMGNDLAQALFDSILPALKPYLGLCPPLDGPGPDLWLSPSDLLIGKVKLKPPLTSKHVRALTHEGIMEIGKVIERKVENEHLLDKERAIADNEIMVKYRAAKELREAVAQVTKEKQAEHEAIVEELKLEFKEELKEQLNRLADQLEKDKIAAVEAGKKEKEVEMEGVLERAVQETVCRLTEQYARELYRQSKKLHAHFWYHIKQEKLKLKETVELQKQEAKRKLDELHAELQTENIANIMFVLANERRKCSCEKEQIENGFLAQIKLLENELEERTVQLGKMIIAWEKSGRQVKSRETVLFEIIRQFRKFIYFVLRSVPTQAEYLLSVEKLMIFELTKSVMETNPELFLKYEKIEQEMSGEEESISSNTPCISKVSSEENSLFINGKDYHLCENVARYDPSEHSLKGYEDLPYFLFNENLYCREDFRNMLSQGIRITRSHELWSFKNNDIIEELVRSSSSDNLQGKMDRFIEYDTHVDFSGQPKSAVSVRFSQNEERILKCENYTDDLNSQHELKANKRPVHAKPEVKYIDKPTDSYTSLLSTKSIAHEESPSPMSKLELARDSIDLVLQKKGTSTVNVINKSPTPSKHRDSIQSSSVKITEKFNSKISKLVLTVDSLELVKSNKSIHSKQEDNDVVKKTKVNMATQCTNDDLTRHITISHIEIIDEMKSKPSAVSFYEIPKVIPDEELEQSEEEVLEKAVQPQEEQQQQQQPQPKPQQQAQQQQQQKPGTPPPRIDRQYKPTHRIVGERDATEHLENVDEFTAKRVRSFIRIFRENPSLRNLFTESAKN